MPDIEFLDGDVDGGAGDDEPVRLPRRDPPRWVTRAAVVAFAAAVVTAVAINGDNPAPRRPVATPTPAPTPSPRSDTDTAVPQPEGLGADIGLGRQTGAVLAAVVAGRSTWLLRPTMISVDTPRATLNRAVPAPTRRSGTEQLYVDAPADLAWVLFQDGTDVRAVVYRAATLALLRTITYPGTLHGAAALEGRLYVSIDDGVVAMAPAAAPRVVARPRRGAPLGQLVADPRGHRVLALGLAPVDARFTAIYAVAVPSGEVSARRLLPTAQATLAVSAGGRIWLAGRDRGDGVLMSLDPRTLRPALHSALDPILAPFATVVAGGDRVVWVRDGTGPVLRCIDASTGNQLQTWMIDGPVGSASGSAVVGFGSRASALELRTCPG